MSCAHQNLESHFKESKTGWSKDKVFKKHGPPSETQEDSRFQYYIYVFNRDSKIKNKPSEVWQVRYIFENNLVKDVVKERHPSPTELDKLDPKIDLNKNKSQIEDDKDSRFNPL